jgi:hypothetical protein
MSSTMKCKILLFAGCFLIIAGISTVRAAENIIGDWTFTMEMPADMGGMGGPGGGGMSMTINSTFSKGADGVITGTWVMNIQGGPGMGGPGMGGPGGPGAGAPGAGGPAGFGGAPGMGGPGGGMGAMPTFKIVDVKIDGQKLSFTRKAEGGGDAGGMGGMMSADRQFTGTIKGDAIELKSTSDFGEMTYKGTRKAAGTTAPTTAASAATGLEGAWEFVTTFGDMGMEIKANATFKKETDGKYTCKWEGLPMEGMGAPGGDMGAMPQPAVTVSDIKLDGEKLTFVQKVDLSQMGMGEMTSNFSGTLKGDKIEGKLSSEMGDNPTIGTRKKAAAAPIAPSTPAAPAAAGGDALTGNWELTMSMGDMGMGMPMEFNIKSAITKDAAGKYAMTWQQSMNAPAGGMGGPEGGMGGGMPQPSVTISDIKLDGEKLTFTQKVSFGDMGGMGGPDGGAMEMTSKFNGTVKNNVMEGKMSMEDSGMGMGAMEFTVKGSKK